jgi:O-antigen/teichoic acid export membrane protein
MDEIKENKSSLMTQSSWLMFAKFIGFALSFLLPLMVSRILSKADVGVYQQVFIVIANANSLLAFGMGMSAYYYLSRDPEKRRFYIFNILIFNFAIGGLAFLFLNFYPQFLDYIFKTDSMAPMSSQIGLVIWFWLFSSFLETVVIANQESKLATVFIILAQLTKMVLMVSAVYYFGNVQSMLNAVTIQVFIQTAVLLLYLNSRFKGFWHSFDKNLLIQQLKYAIPFGLMGVLWILQSESHNYFVGHRFSEEEMAVYRYGCFELPLLSILYESVGAVMIPRMSELQREGKIREMIELSSKASEKLALFYFPAYVLFMISASTFVITLFTRKFSDAFNTDPIVRSFENLGKYILKVRIVIVALMLFTLWLGMQYLNLSGMITIVVITALIERFISVRKVCQQVGFKWVDLGLFKNVGKIAVIAILAGIPAYFVYNFIQPTSLEFGKYFASMIWQNPLERSIDSLSGLITLGVMGLIYALFYMFGLLYWRVISGEEKELIKLRISNLPILKRIFFRTAPVVNNQ